MKLPLLSSRLMATVASTASGQCSIYQSRINALASSIHPRVLTETRGSGNYGESGVAAFYTIDKLPFDLSASATNKTALQKVDIDLGPDRLAFYIDSVLTHDEADALAACAESILTLNGHSRMAPGINTPPGMRVNEAAHWYPSQLESQTKFLGPILERIRHLVPPTLGGMPLHSKISEKVAQFKYSTGDRFNQHIDGLFPGQGANEQGDGVEEWEGVVSGMSMLFYLNDGPTDGLEGGETRLWSADGSKYFDMVPKKGRVLFFRRGSHDAVLHAGLPVKGEVPKYMALINLAYGKQTGSRPLM